MAFENDKYYRTGDPALKIIASRGTLAVWRHQGRGPIFYKFGNKILYKGADLKRIFGLSRSRDEKQLTNK